MRTARPARKTARAAGRAASGRAAQKSAPRRPRAAPSRLPASRAGRVAALLASRAAAYLPARERAPFLAALVVALVAACFLLPRAAAPAPTFLWRGYQTLAVRADAAGPAVLNDVASLLGPGVIAEGSAAAEYWDFSGLSRVPYAELDGRLDPSDPRRDRYMAGAEAYFWASGAGAQWRLFYIPSRAPDGLAFLRIARILGFPLRGEWRLVDFDLPQKALSILALIGFSTLLALSNGRQKRPSLTLALVESLLWVPTALGAGLAELSLSLVLILAWFPLLRVSLLTREWDRNAWRELREPIAVFCGLGVAGLILICATKGISAAAVFGLLLPLGSSLVLLPVLPRLLFPAAGRRRGRAIFEPVPIVKPSLEALRARPVALVFAALLLAATAIVPAVRGPALPTPVAIRGARDFSWGGLARLGRASRAQRLPDTSDFVAHAAFQETMAFGRPWKLPFRDERVYLREFAANPATGAIVATLRMVKVFDSAWLANIRGRAVAGSLEALLFAQGRPVAVVLRKPGRALLKDLPMTVLAALLLLATAARDMGLVKRPLIRFDVVRFNSAARRRKVQ
jgi:hypothetical protein